MITKPSLQTLRSQTNGSHFDAKKWFLEAFVSSDHTVAFCPTSYVGTENIYHSPLKDQA